MLIVADQGAFGVGRERRFPRSREAKEQRDIARRTHVSRAMHRQVAGFGQQEIQHAENRFLDFTRILRAADQHGSLTEVDHDESAGRGSVYRWVCGHVGQVDDRPIGHKAFAGLRRGAQEHVLREQIVPGVGRHHPHADLQAFVGPGGKILHEQALVCCAGFHQGFKLTVVLGRHRLIDGAPVDLALGQGIADGKLVFGRPTGEFTGAGHQRALSAELTLIQAQRPGDQVGPAQVPVHLARLRGERQGFSG